MDNVGRQEYEGHKTVCGHAFDRILQAVEEVKKETAIINKRLFINNGDLSLQTIVDRNTQFLKFLKWALSIIFVTWIGITATDWHQRNSYRAELENIGLKLSRLQPEVPKIEEVRPK